MKTRDQLYSKNASKILRDITNYHNMQRGQVLKMYPGQEEKVSNLLSFLVRQRRIFYSARDDIYYDNMDMQKEPETLSALWVLADFADRAEFHTSADFPVKIIFFYNGDTYDIIYVAKGKEALIEHALAQQEEEAGIRLVIIEQTDQIPQLHIPGVAAFCIVTESGDVQYYKGGTT